MKTLLFFIVYLLPFLVFSQTGETIKVTTYPTEEYQMIDGFGASDAWRAQFVGKNWPLEKRNKIADLLFSQENDKDGKPKGIGLSIWRFNISAGTSEQGDSSDIDNVWRRGESFLNSEGTYDWSKLEGQRWFINAAKERGVEKLLAFPNSPPVYYTNNGKGYAAKGNIHFNLKPGYMRKYANYLVDVVDHFNQEDIYFDYLSPVNEPQWNWDGTGQEGTPALNEEVYSFVRYLSSELSRRELKTNIVIGEAGTIGHASLPMEKIGKNGDGRDNQAEFFFAESSPFYIADLPNVEKTISAHSYHTVWPLEFQTDNRKMVNEYISKANPDLGYWMSEYCILQKNGEIGKGGGRDLGMPTAMYVARIIHNDLTLTNAKSWQWWTAISQFDYKDGLVYLDDGSDGESGRMGSDVESLQFDGKVRESKLLWILGNYSRFVRPGMVRVRCELSQEQSIENGLLVSAYLRRSDDTLVFIFTNLSNEYKSIDIGVDQHVDVYVTSVDKSLNLKTENARSLSLSARSVSTVILK